MDERMKQRSWKPDHAAQKILLETFWSSAGWKSSSDLSPDRREIALRAGYMFEPLVFRHDTLIGQLATLRSMLEPQDIGRGFAASLSSGRLDLRSALGSFAATLNLPSHALCSTERPFPNSLYRECGLCGFLEGGGPTDLNALSFERFKWGGVRHEEIEYAAFDLGRYAISAPDSDEDFEVGLARLRALLEVAGNMPSSATPNELLKHLKGVVPGNANELRALLGCLGYAGVLQPSDRPGFLEGYPVERPHPGGKNDWPYPLAYWRGIDIVNLAAVNFYFPRLAA